jgi:uncharacterized membrane protein
MPEGADLCSQCGEALQKVPPEVPAGLRERAVAVACYLTPLPAILFLYLKSYRHSVFVRFHAFQSIILGVAVLVLISVGTLLANIGWTVAWLMFGLLFCVGLFFLWLVLSIKAAQGIRFQLPVLGSEAAKRAVR